jgi:phospholipid/cholesterol/gamma-HCH transport system permease protein
MLPLLVIIADAIALYGTYVGVNIEGDFSFHLFFLQIIEKLSFQDVFPSIIKTFFFGFAIGLIACYKGLNASKGTEGVGEAANAAVVHGSIAVFVLDMIAVQLTSLLT